ncbi:MAG: hypothetical protein ABR581_07410 [Thermoleophilaceae bacterium]
MRLLAAVLSGFIAALAGPTVASAATYYVDVAGPLDGDCLSPATACRSIQDGVDKTKNDVSPGPDTVHVAAGTYLGEIEINDGFGGYNDTTVEGAGSSGQAGSITRLIHDGAWINGGVQPVLSLGAGGEDHQHDITVRDLRVEVPDPIAADGINANVPGARLENVAVDVDCGCIGIRVLQDGSVLDGVSVSPLGAGGVGLYVNGQWAPTITVNRSRIWAGPQSDQGVGGFALEGVDAKLAVTRSAFRSTNSSAPAVLLDRPFDATFESTLITGGDAGLRVLGFWSGTAVTVRNGTIDSPAAVSVDSANTEEQVRLFDSLVEGELALPATVSGSPKSAIDCTRSDLQLTEIHDDFGDINCGPTKGNRVISLSTFIDRAGGDYRLARCSPAVDSGASPSPYPGGTLDLAGAPRIADGNLDGVETLDRGAYEVPQPAAAPPCASEGGSVTGGDGSAGGSSGPPQEDQSPPFLSELTLKPGAFHPARRGPAIMRSTGARLGYRLSERAQLRLRIQKRRLGRRVRGRCRPTTRRNRRRAPCARYVTLRGILSLKRPAGPSSVHLSGRLRGRRLRAGRYRLRVGAIDAAGNRAKPRRIRFRILP